MKRKSIVVISIGLLLFLIPGVAFADGWVESTVGNVIGYVLTLIFKPIFDTMVEVLGNLMFNKPLNDYIYIKNALKYTQYIAGALLTTTLAFQLWRANTRAVFADQREPIPNILFKALISGVLIYGLPSILNYMVRINGILIDGIKSMGVDFTGGLMALAFPGTNTLVLTLFFVIFVIALVGLTISNTIRYAELCFLYIIGPILAVSHAGKGETFQLWVMQAIAVTFTQSVQFFLVGFALNVTANVKVLANWYDMLLPIGAIVLAIRGPQVLKQFLFSTGTGGAAGNMAQQAFSTAIYKKMMTK